MKKYSLIVLMFLAVIAFTQDVYRANDSTFVYPCIYTDSTTNYNFVGLPLQTNFVNASGFDPTGTNIDAVSRYDAVAQGWETAGYHPVFGWCTDFPVETGEAYMISAINSFDFIVTGDSVEVVYDLITTSGLNNNMIVVPLTKPELTNVNDLGRDIEWDSYQISKYDVLLQSWVTSDYSFMYLPDFPVEIGMPLCLNMNRPKTWPSIEKRDNYSEIMSNENKTKGPGYCGPRIVYFNCHDMNGEEFDFPEESDQISLSAFIRKRSAEVLNEDIIVDFPI